ncbi:hypothetical protein [Intestinirhabdus alba]|jgi:hypothetical protein|uniref:Fimbrial protein n=1 Tax=Intestinirhabdus alba TaxID=2899544 RepID=A0A6L6II21_9ENTR|nr:hypothetical protein [Intestinirhabdus alba]MTH45584.1 hypothetical protein [Intestinirhabdus alba]
MKAKVLSAIAVMAVSASALAASPSNYDTKFNVSANVPDSAMITDPSGRPITDLDVVLTPAASGKMEAQTEQLALWNNDVSKLDVSLTLDDSAVATGSPFTLYSTQGDVLNNMTYQISSITADGAQQFTKSGDSKDFSLKANGTHGEMPVRFKFVSDANYTDIGQGNYTGVVYANVVAKV